MAERVNFILQGTMVVITTPKTLSASAKTTIAMSTDAVDFDFEIELEVLTAQHMDSRIPKSQIANFHKIFNHSDCC